MSDSSKVSEKSSPRDSGDGQHLFHLPSPLPTKRNRTYSQSQRAHEGPLSIGMVTTFHREKGHGFIKPDNEKEDIFMHISDIESEYELKDGDRVVFKKCPIPPKMEKYSAVHVKMLQPKQGVEHQTWDNTHQHPEI